MVERNGRLEEGSCEIFCCQAACNTNVCRVPQWFLEVSLRGMGDGRAEEDGEPPVPVFIHPTLVEDIIRNGHECCVLADVLRE